MKEQSSSESDEVDRTYLYIFNIFAQKHNNLSYICRAGAFCARNFAFSQNGGNRFFIKINGDNIF